MGIYDRDYYRDEGPRGFSLGGSRSMVTNLLIINVAIFIGDAIFSDGQGGGLGGLSRFLAVTPGTIIQPWCWWRFVTYGFAHASPPHILGNMLGLFFFGRNIEALYGPRKFLGMYLTAIVAGSIVWSVQHFATTPVSRWDLPLVGASGAVTAVILLFCINFPKQTVLFMLVIPMPAWILGVVIIFMDVTGHMGNQGRVAHAVHLIGAAYAYFFYRTRIELGQFISMDWIGKLKRNKRRPKLRVHAPKNSSDDDQLDRKADAVLDKLHRQGEASLSKSERRILEEYARRMKQRRG